MASRNMNKIKPWMLAKNTDEIVSSYVQKIYKQMPLSFNKGLKTCKVATLRPENRGPLSTWKNQQKQMPDVVIMPKTAVVKNSHSKMKQHTNNVMNFFKSNKLPISNFTPSKRLVKTPNYKIYKSLRYGSSCSSSRSSIFKRYDDRKRPKQSSLAQINYLIRSFHTSKFEPTYARFLMPARNQQLDTKLGSIPDAIKFSNNMLKDLMEVNRCTKIKIASQEKNALSVKSSKGHGLDKWNRPPSLSKYKIKTPKDGFIKTLKPLQGNSMRNVQLSPENRDYARLNVGRASHIKHPKPAHELFTAQHDRLKTELHEKHRRIRMKKLGLIKSPKVSENLLETEDKSLNPNKTAITNLKSVETEVQKPQKLRTATSLKQIKLSNQPENTYNALIAENSFVPLEKKNTSVQAKRPLTAETSEKTTFIQNLKTVQKSCIPIPTKFNSIKAAPSKYTSFISSATSPAGYTTISPIVALRAQMPHKADSGSYRYHRHDFFSTKKY